MAEYVGIGQGTYNTVAGSIGLASAVLGNGFLGNIFGGNRAAGTYEQSAACMHDLDSVKELAEKDAEIARLNSERYADAAKAEAKEYAQNGIIDVYKELKSDINGLKESAAAKWTDQAVINANITNGMTDISAQAQNTAALVAQITKTAVPSSAICNFSGGCTSCGSNV